MEKEFVPHDRTLRMKALGFDEPCFAYRGGCGGLMIKETPHCVISAPTFSQAFRWFREKYFIHHKIGRDFDIWEYELYDFKSGNKHIPTGFKTFKIYEEAELACLDKLIEIVEGITEPK